MFFTMITRGSINESDAAGCYQKRQISKKPCFQDQRFQWFYKREAELCGTKSKIKQKIYVRTLEQTLFCAKQTACMFKHDTREDMAVFFFFFFPFFLHHGDYVHEKNLCHRRLSFSLFYESELHHPCIKMSFFFFFFGPFL